MDKENLKKKVEEKFFEFLSDPVIRNTIFQEIKEYIMGDKDFMKEIAQIFTPTKGSELEKSKVIPLRKEIQILNEELTKGDEEIVRLKLEIEHLKKNQQYSKRGIEKKEIFEKMREILKKSISNISIIVPNIIDLKELSLYELKASITINVVCSILIGDNEQDELLEELEGLDNITIREHDSKDRFALLRDGEEFLIVLVGKSPDKNLLIYTDDPEHIKLLNYLVLQPWFRSRKT